MKNVKLYWNLGQTFLRIDNFPVPELMPDLEIVRNVFTIGTPLKIPVFKDSLTLLKEIISLKSNGSPNGRLFLSIGSNTKGYIEFVGAETLKVSIYDHMAINEKINKKKEYKVYDLGFKEHVKTLDFKYTPLNGELIDSLATSKIILHKKQIRFVNPLMNLLSRLSMKLKFRFRKKFLVVRHLVSFKYAEHVPVYANHGLIVSLKILYSKTWTEKVIEKQSK